MAKEDKEKKEAQQKPEKPSKETRQPKEQKQTDKKVSADAGSQKGAAQAKAGKPAKEGKAEGAAAPQKGQKGQQAAAVFMTAIKAISSRKEGVSRKQARKSIHPKYMECKIVCGCGNVVKTRATVPEIQVGVCSNCHPFYTGSQKFVDTAGRVEKFQQRYKWTADKALEKSDEAKKAKKTRK